MAELKARKTEESVEAFLDTVTDAAEAKAQSRHCHSNS